MVVVMTADASASDVEHVVTVVHDAGGEAFASRDLFTIPLAELRSANEGWMPGYMGG